MRILLRRPARRWTRPRRSSRLTPSLDRRTGTPTGPGSLTLRAPTVVMKFSSRTWLVPTPSFANGKRWPTPRLSNGASCSRPLATRRSTRGSRARSGHPAPRCRRPRNPSTGEVCFCQQLPLRCAMHKEAPSSHCRTLLAATEFSPDLNAKESSGRADALIEREEGREKDLTYRTARVLYHECARAIIGFQLDITSAIWVSRGRRRREREFPDLYYSLG
ncbi:Yae1 protein [Colletotrichum scovillei]|uniref:Yae1 protein n=1 Tax=Colletotrichum scovillei TaxID=1209932 RepID=A0A9P7RKQ3_9PEZI|nr:Yae1 protein [Colletotrichum scovillei]KAG7077065.1 Yae1 protein [Colletotrichum scovillei]KAG7084173.1 Yae1 protein [Colletotrichum scovillei]